MPDSAQERWTQVLNRFDDIELRIDALEIGVSVGNEQRLRWFDNLSRLTTDVLKNRQLIRELEDKSAGENGEGSCAARTS